MKRVLKGYMTVELSTLFPVVFITICFLFYMCFCFHDRVVLQTFLYRFCINSNYHNLTEKELNEKIKTGINQRMLMSDLVSAEYSETGFNIEARAKLRFMGTLWKNNRFDTKIIIENINKSDNLRKYKFLKEVAE